MNRGDEAAFFAAVPAARAVRTYYDTPDVFPAVWPRKAGKGVWQLDSIRPTPWMLLHHRLDAKIRSLAATAPPHSLLTIWHENANGRPGCLSGPCNPLGYPAGLRDPRRFVRMQEYVQRLVRGTPVRFGTIGCGPVASNPEWYAPGLDWYGFDMYWNAGYDNPDGSVSKVRVWARLSANLAALRKASGERYPLIRIGESNAGYDWRRRAWFTDQASWFASHDGRRPAWIETAWFRNKTGAQGGLSGPWPPSEPVIDRLDWLSEAYR